MPTAFHCSHRHPSIPQQRELFIHYWTWQLQPLTMSVLQLAPLKDVVIQSTCKQVQYQLVSAICIVNWLCISNIDCLILIAENISCASVTAIRNNAVHVSWMPLLLPSDGTLVGYTVFYGQRELNSLQVTDGVTQVDITNINLNNNMYQFTIMAEISINGQSKNVNVSQYLYLKPSDSTGLCSFASNLMLLQYTNMNNHNIPLGIHALQYLTFWSLATCISHNKKYSTLLKQTKLRYIMQSFRIILYPKRNLVCLLFQTYLGVGANG